MGEEVGGTYIVTAQDSDDFSAAVELHKEALVEVLGTQLTEGCRWGTVGWRDPTFLSSG